MLYFFQESLKKAKNVTVVRKMIVQNKNVVMLGMDCILVVNLGSSVKNLELKWWEAVS
jgi:hypothetical protein